MPAWLLALLPKAFDLVISIFGGGKKEAGFNDGREFGRAEQQVADMKGGIETIRAAEIAAKKAAEERTDDDPMDRARR